MSRGFTWLKDHVPLNTMMYFMSTKLDQQAIGDVKTGSTSSCTATKNTKPSMQIVRWTMIFVKI